MTLEALQPSHEADIGPTTATNLGRQPRPPYRAWLTTEVALMRAHYSTVGGVAMQAMLPGRAYGAVLQKAYQLGLSHPKGTYAHVRGEAFDAAVRALYLAVPERGAVRAAAEQWKVPRQVLTERARALGLLIARFKDPTWSRAEIALIEQHAALSSKVIRRKMLKAGYRRSATAIVVKLKRLGTNRDDPDHWTAGALARLMGVDPKTVAQWIAKQGLPATRRGTNRTPQQGGDQFWIARRALRTWIATHAQQVDLRKVDRFWFIDLAFGGGG